MIKNFAEKKNKKCIFEFSDLAGLLHNMVQKLLTNSK